MGRRLRLSRGLTAVVLITVIGTAMVPLLAVGGGSAAAPLRGAGSGIPARVLTAYQAVDGWCNGLRWQLVAAIGQVESGHGTSGGAKTDETTGEVTPWIFGPPLDGTNSTERIPIGDGLGWWGLTGPWAQAVGPMQFLPSTFARWGVDADRDGTANPHDIDDAAASAANYLCGGHDGAITDERAAVLRYNNSAAYADEVLAIAEGLANPALVIGEGWLCPVAGPVSFTDTWGAPRSGGRTHKGVDMFAARDTPAVAPVAGTVEHRSDPLGGLAFHLWGDDGNYYYGAHLSRYGTVDGHVAAGTILGYVGDTGNAVSTSPHLHFEIHPGRQRGDPPAAVNPTPTVAAACTAHRLGVALSGGD